MQVAVFPRTQRPVSEGKKVQYIIAFKSIHFGLKFDLFLLLILQNTCWSEISTHSTEPYMSIIWKAHKAQLGNVMHTFPAQEF